MSTFVQSGATGALIGTGGTSVTNVQDTTYTTSTAGGSTVGGSGNSAISASLQNGSISITQDSPAAIAGLVAVANQALNSIASSSAYTTGKALDIASQKTQSEIQQYTPIVVAIIIAVVAGIFFYKR